MLAWTWFRCAAMDIMSVEKNMLICNNCNSKKCSAFGKANRNTT